MAGKKFTTHEMRLVVDENDVLKKENLRLRREVSVLQKRVGAKKREFPEYEYCVFIIRRSSGEMAGRSVVYDRIEGAQNFIDRLYTPREDLVIMKREVGKWERL